MAYILGTFIECKISECTCPTRMDDTLRNPLMIETVNLHMHIRRNPGLVLGETYLLPCDVVL